MCSGNATPNDSNLRSSNLSLRTVDESNLLSEVEVCCLGIIHTLDFDQGGAWVGVALAALVAQMTALDIKAVTSF